MSWRLEKSNQGQDIVWSAVEKGIASGPLKGTANLQNVNIATETGEAMVSFGRVAQQQTSITGGTLTASVSDGATLLAAISTLNAGAWIQVTASTISGITASSGATTAGISYLIVGGGGGGGGSLTFVAGGGGGGQVNASTGSVSVASYAVTVGAGGTGAGSSGVAGSDGSSSSIATIGTAVGGGGGGGANSSFNGRSGASGGGGGSDGATAGTGGSATAGNAGGNARSAATISGGGGGGSGGVGSNGTSGNGGNGGAGTSNSLTGTATFYGAGGGGGGVNNGGTGGSSIGGSGGASGNLNGSDGLVNSGSGGGGAGGNAVSSSGTGGSGGSGIVVISYTTGDLYAVGGTISRNGTKTVHTFTSNGVFQVLYVNAGGYYYVDFKNTSNKVKLSTHYDPYGTNPLTHGTSGTATYNIVAVMGQGVAKTTEKYNTATGTEYRYYVLDNSGRVWVYDTAVYTASLAASGVGTLWMLPDHLDYSSFNLTGMSTLNGWLNVVSNTTIYGKPTSDLGRPFIPLPGATLNNPFPTHTNFAYTGHQGKMYYCDGNYIGEVFATTSIETGIANIQSFSQYTGSSTTGTISAVIGGGLPYSPDGTHIPVVFFTDEYGTMPTAINEGTVYYLNYSPGTQTFQAFTSIGATTGALDLSTGASGNQYFNTFYPIGASAGATGTHPLVQITTQRVNLPYFERAQCMVELGNTVLIGCITNAVYPWNQVDATPSDVIELPEANVKTMINVNNMGYIFAGNKGNVYVTNNSVASLALKVPDYIAGVPGTSSTYIEPYFTWGDSMYLRGRVYFSILDQTSSKAGNAGGVWSFVPAQNFSMDNDSGTALRLENQNSYGNYSGMATLLIAMQNQLAIAPQYWATWQTSYSAGTSSFGIDFTNSVPTATGIIETDLLATGTFLDKRTFQQVEYKLSTPLASGDSVQIYYRLNSTDAWASCGGVILETSNPLSGYFNTNFQKTQWLQLRAVLTSNNLSTTSFVRVTEFRIR